MAGAMSMWDGGAAKRAAGAALIAAAAAGMAGSMLVPRVPAGIRAEARADLRLDINTASAAELESLPRIGPALAKRIVEDRAARGIYHSVEDLDRVPGIGPRTIAGLREFVRVGE